MQCVEKEDHKLYCATPGCSPLAIYLGEANVVKMEKWGTSRRKIWNFHCLTWLLLSTQTTVQTSNHKKLVGGGFGCVFKVPSGLHGAHIVLAITWTVECNWRSKDIHPFMAGAYLAMVES